MAQTSGRLSQSWPGGRVTGTVTVRGVKRRTAFGRAFAAQVAVYTEQRGRN